jgi:hypothetical protein
MNRYHYNTRACCMVVVGTLFVLLLMGFVLYAIIHTP